MIPLKTRIERAIEATRELIQPEYSLAEILDALEELRDQIEVMINAVEDDVEREEKADG